MIKEKYIESFLVSHRVFRSLDSILCLVCLVSSTTFLSSKNEEKKVQLHSLLGMRDEQDVDSNAMFWVLYPQKMKDPFFYHWKTNGKYIQPCFHYGLHQIAMRVETTDKALTKKKNSSHYVCIEKKKKNVNHWHPITVVLVEATNELWPKKKKNKPFLYLKF